MKKKELDEIVNTAAEHFEGDLKEASAAAHFGLGVFKMKKASLVDDITPEDAAACKAIYDEVSAHVGTRKAPSAKTATRKARSATAKTGDASPSKTAEKKKGLSRMNRTELLAEAKTRGVEVPEDLTVPAIAALIRNA
jgi:hypothetical protein